jgi:hypothetical protein
MAVNALRVRIQQKRTWWPGTLKALFAESDQLILIVEPLSRRPPDLGRVSAAVTGVSGSSDQDCSTSEKAIRTPPVASPKMLGNRAAASGVATAALAVS